MDKDRVLTGIRSNGVLHLGNYLGAVLPMVEIQKKHSNKHEMFFFVPDLHSFTTPVDHNTLYEHTMRNLKLFAACGMDFWARDTYLYRQSFVPAHSELAWVLSCFASFGELSRMTQFKEKATEHAGVGLFNYPVLMAADILLYNTKYVPVGEDQQQHLELARDLAMRLNNKFKDVFEEGVFETIPLEWKKQLEFANRENGVRIRSLRNPEKKMSKSVDDPNGTIELMEDPELAVKKVMSATTDSIGVINLDWDKQPGISNLLQILALLKGKPINEVAGYWKGKKLYGELKSVTAEAVRDFLTDLQAKYVNIDEDKLHEKLKDDEERVAEIANTTLLRVQQAVGLRPRD